MPKDPSIIDSETRIVGHLWNTFQVSKYYNKEDSIRITNDNLESINGLYNHLTSQQTNYLGQSEASIFIKEGDVIYSVMEGYEKDSFRNYDAFQRALAES